MKAVLKFRFGAFIHSAEPFFLFIFSSFMILLLGQYKPVSEVLPAALIMATLGTSINSFGLNLAELKDSTIIKRIGVTPITRNMFVFASLLFTTLTLLFSYLWVLFIVIVFMYIPGVLPGEIDGVVNNISAFNNVNWFWFTIAFIISALLGISIALFFISITSTPGAYNICAQLYFNLVIFGGGIFFVIDASVFSEALSWIVPHAYINELFTSAFYGASPFHTSDGMFSTTSGSNIIGYSSDFFGNGAILLQPVEGSDGVYEFDYSIYNPYSGETIPVTVTIGDGVGILEDQVAALEPVYAFTYKHTVFGDLLMPIILIIILTGFSVKLFKPKD